jgi:hypothetical protein
MVSVEPVRTEAGGTVLELVESERRVGGQSHGLRSGIWSERCPS